MHTVQGVSATRGIWPVLVRLFPPFAAGGTYSAHPPSHSAFPGESGCCVRVGNPHYPRRCGHALARQVEPLGAAIIFDLKCVPSGNYLVL